MENMGDLEHKNLVNELRMGMEVARQLQIHLNIPSSSRDTRELLVEKILSSYKKIFSMLNLSSLIIRGFATSGMQESQPLSLSGSPRRNDQDYDRDLNPKDAYRKRKKSGRWKKQVQVNPGMGLEGPLDDGFSWRKYGQKDILGAKYPRGYYRCTRRIVQGCLATKQVQRSDEDPTIFDITYRGRHTCTQMLHHNQETNSTFLHPQQQQQQENQNPSQDLLLRFRSGLKVITEQQSIPDFPLTSNQVFSPSPSSVDNNFMGNINISPSFISPSTSTGNTNYFSASSSGLHENSFGATNQSMQTCDSDMIAAATSATNSPTAGVDFPFANIEFYPNFFSFDNHGFIS